MIETCFKANKIKVKEETKKKIARKVIGNLVFFFAPLNNIRKSVRL